MLIRDYVVVYCFVNTWLNTGISKPDGYSREEILSIFRKTRDSGDDNTHTATQRMSDGDPNILFCRLESFHRSDDDSEHHTFRDPCPNFRKLMQTYSSAS